MGTISAAKMAVGNRRKGAPSELWKQLNLPYGTFAVSGPRTIYGEASSFDTAPTGSQSPVTCDSLTTGNGHFNLAGYDGEGLLDPLTLIEKYRGNANRSRWS